MSILVDTNILSRLANITDPLQLVATQAILKLNQANVEIRLVPQVLYEYWAVATRPLNVNGLGMTTQETEDSLNDLTSTYALSRDEGRVYDLWKTLVATHSVKGKNAHDARIVAAMLCHGMTNLLSFNKPDFARFTGIQVFTPVEILAGQILI